MTIELCKCTHCGEYHAPDTKYCPVIIDKLFVEFARNRWCVKSADMGIVMFLYVGFVCIAIGIFFSLLVGGVLFVLAIITDMIAINVSLKKVYEDWDTQKEELYKKAT